MDFDGDGCIDIVSGSYSREDKDMAGLFQVLRGNRDGTFDKAAVLEGSDGKPLMLPHTERVTERICTRAFVVDLDGDGKLDLVAGNFMGMFGLFRGEGAGKFAPQSTWLTRDGEPLRVDVHGDPCLVDIDRDGDFDLVSGSARGGVFLFVNEGSKTEPKFGARQTLLEPAGHGVVQGDDGEPAAKFGDGHLTGPASDTRVWVDDVDGDGKLDLLVGDRITLLHVVKGVDEKDAHAKLAAWSKKQQAFFKQPQGDGDAAQKKWQEEYEALEKERETFAHQEHTGFVWLVRGK